MAVVTLSKVEDFEDFVRSPSLAVVHFSAEWAEQCKQVTDILNELGNLSDIKSSGCKFAVCDAEGISEVSLKYKIDSVPTVILFKNSNQIDRIDGVDVSQITSKVKAHCSSKAVAEIKQPIEERLKLLINKHKVMVFMKGNRDTPRCGFSRTLIQILNDIGVQYDTFDILTDEEVRQGLKVYSDWPTYPQVYVNGDLIGGLDIIKELQANGELESTLNA
ncbi:glutaredoxin 3 [Leptidea sinapis]|uniref:glutaredoxin 3 n=1 Tax=Leptidea sinapis TaxID=189913 RepID=UPI00213AC85F|nr:glutaredoxin 3 [Leptidea sinapis]